jgi:hypothetical protein
MYHRLKVIRAGILGIVFSLLVMLAIIPLSYWFGSMGYLDS